MAAAARVCEDPPPFLERRILFRRARDAALLASLPPGVEPLNQGFNAAAAAAPATAAAPPTASPDAAKGIKRSRQESNGAAASNALPDAGRPVPLRIGAGLTNLGNTCFLNSVLQCLTYTQPLADFLKSGQHKLSCRKIGFCAMCALEAHVKTALQSWGKVIAPNHIVKNLRSVSRAFQPWRQEDAHEFLRYLLESLQKDCLPQKTPMNSPEQEKTLLYKIFGGRLRSQVKCTNCLEHSETVDPFLDLSLDINRADSLGKALARFTANEILDGDNKYHCEKCKKKVRAIKRFTIETAPNILTVQFKRFSSTGLHGQKIDKKVHFDKRLDITPFMGNSRDGAVYDLYGVLVHAGWSTRSGHYYCFVRTTSDLWHALDDSRVQQVSEQNVLGQKAYILFYIRKPPVQKPPPAQKPTPSEVPRKKPCATKSLFVPGVAEERKASQQQQQQEEALPAATRSEEKKEDKEVAPEPATAVEGDLQEKQPVATGEKKATVQENGAVQAEETKKPNPDKKKEKEGTEVLAAPPAAEKQPAPLPERESNAKQKTASVSSNGKTPKHAPELQPPETDIATNIATKLEKEPVRKADRGYLKLLRAMPRNRRLLMEKALGHEQNSDNGDAAVPIPKPKKPAEADEPKKKKPAAAKVSAPNELFGSGVGRWEGVDGERIDRFLNVEHKIVTKRPNEWDEEYDRGKLKKSKRNAGGSERITPLKNSDPNPNPFQALASKKQS